MNESMIACPCGSGEPTAGTVGAGASVGAWVAGATETQPATAKSATQQSAMAAALLERFDI